MTDTNAREQLLDLLDKQAFDPVLDATPEKYGEGDRQKLVDAQKTTRSTKKRYHDSYTSAQDVYDNFKDDLSSDAANQVQKELRSLGLPTLDQVKPDFDKLAHKLGVD